MCEKTILLELTYNTLVRYTKQAFDDGREKRSSEVKVSNTIFVPMIDNNSLEISSETRTNDGTYKSKVIFNGVFYRDEESPTTATVMGVDGEEYIFERINKNRTKVKVMCNCLDFYYRFAVFNKTKDALAGDPPPAYVKKTDRPPVNPAKSAGLCKHIIRLVDELDSSGIFS